MVIRKLSLFARFAAFLAIALVVACSGDDEERNSSNNQGGDNQISDDAGNQGDGTNDTPPGETAVGQLCERNADCASDLCLPLGDGRAVCTEECTSTDECLPGWECGAFAGVAHDICTCDVQSEHCSGAMSDKHVDLLWVIDNTGSMCRQQAVIRDRFEEFIGHFVENNIDFHIGVTTTHMLDSSNPLEPVARPGHLQSTPQPIPAFSNLCHFDLNANGEPDYDGEMTPVLEAIDLAVSCTQNPSEWAHLLEPDLDALRCLFNPEPGTCSEFLDQNREDFFPSNSAYREIPKVLRASDYRLSDGSDALDIERLRADFSCMSFVGTRGHGFRKGLLAAVTALSPELNGPGGPNEGFLRDNARQGVIFVSNNNDCSHDGELNESSSCALAECTFDENDGVNLLPVEEVKSELMQNLQAAKSVEFTEEDILVASIHGSYQRYTEPRPATCDGSVQLISPSCANELGSAYSGHRYDAFLREFPYFYPAPPSEDPEGPLPGLICDDLGAHIVELGAFIASPVY